MKNILFQKIKFLVKRTNDDKNYKNNSDTKNKDKYKKNKKEDKKDELVDFNTDEENDLFKITPNVKKNQKKIKIINKYIKNIKDLLRLMNILYYYIIINIFIKQLNMN